MPLAHLVQPESAHDEEELDAHGAEWQNASQSDRERGMSVPHLLRHMPVRIRARQQAVVAIRGKTPPKTQEGLQYHRPAGEKSSEKNILPSISRRKSYISRRKSYELPSQVFIV